MNIVRRVRAVERLFETLEKDVQKIKDQTGMHCVENCIECCTTSRIVATTVEFLPLAYHLYKNNLAEDFLLRIAQIDDPKICPVLDRFSVNGSRIGCRHYRQRGLICRLFTYSHYTNKYDRRVIGACKTLQAQQPQQIARANEILQTQAIGPRATTYYQRLQFIDFNGSQKLYPIGDAIRLAIESIVTHFHYNGRRTLKKA